jgi:hypothetical protein
MLICGVLVIYGCHGKQKSDAFLQNQPSKYSDTKYLVSPAYLLTKIDSLNNKPITFYLNHPDMDPLILKIYYGEILPRFSHHEYIYNTSLKSPSVLQPFFTYMSNYVSSCTEIEQNVILNDRKKTWIKRIQETLRIDSLNGQPISFYINHPDLDSLIRDFYYGKFLPSDDDNTFRLLDLITQKHSVLYPFYFHCLNQILNYADGALAEIMGKYCLRMVQSYPNYFFINNKDYLTKYAGFIGYELYEYNSPINTDYNLFIKKLESSSDTTNLKIKEELVAFKKSIQDVFKEMDN